MQIPTIKVQSVKLCALGEQKLTGLIENRLNSNKKTVIFTPNTQMISRSNKDPDLKVLLNSSTLNIPDGTGISIAARLKSRYHIKRTSGIDIAEKMMPIFAKKNYSLFFLGGRQGIADAASKRLKLKIPGLNIVGTHHGYFSKLGRDNDNVKQEINSLKPDILFVCLGFPLQEQWISDNIDSLNSVKLAIGLGGSLDVWSGKTVRAPKFMQKAGLEWLWRIILEPERIKIFSDIPSFMFMAMKEARRA